MDSDPGQRGTELFLSRPIAAPLWVAKEKLNFVEEPNVNIKARALCTSCRQRDEARVRCGYGVADTRHVECHSDRAYPAVVKQLGDEFTDSSLSPILVFDALWYPPANV